MSHKKTDFMGCLGEKDTYHLKSTNRLPEKVPKTRVFLPMTFRLATNTTQDEEEVPLAVVATLMYLLIWVAYPKPEKYS